jgi:hypothetical protein
VEATVMARSWAWAARIVPLNVVSSRDKHANGYLNFSAAPAPVGAIHTRTENNDDWIVRASMVISAWSLRRNDIVVMDNCRTQDPA